MKCINRYTCAHVFAYTHDLREADCLRKGRLLFFSHAATVGAAHLRMVFGKLWQKHSHDLSILILFELGGSTEEASPHHGALLCIATGTVHLRFGEPPTVWRFLPTVLELARSARHG